MMTFCEYGVFDLLVTYAGNGAVDTGIETLVSGGAHPNFAASSPAATDFFNGIAGKVITLKMEIASEYQGSAGFIQRYCAFLGLFVDPTTVNYVTGEGTNYVGDGCAQSPQAFPITPTCVNQYLHYDNEYPRVGCMYANDAFIKSLESQGLASSNFYTGPKLKPFIWLSIDTVPYIPCEDPNVACQLT
jgi:hypothetical protein